MYKKRLGSTSAILFCLSLISCTGKKSLSSDDTKTFKINLNSSDGLKDPLFVLDQERLKVLSLVFEPLLSYSQNGEIVPALLTELPTLSADQQTYTFKLKSGIQFRSSSGEAKLLTANDAVASLLRGVPGDNATNYGNLLTGLVDGLDSWSKKNAEERKKLPLGMKVVDESTFSVRLLRKYPDFLAILTLPAFSVVPADQLENGKLKTAIGTGPYQFMDTAITSANWDLTGDEKLKFPGVKVTSSFDLKDVKNSDYSSLPLKAAAMLIDSSTGNLKDMPEHTLQELRLRRLEMLVFNLSDPLVKSLGVDFRKAILSVLDIDQILNAMYRGFSLKALQFVPPSVEGSLSDSPVKLYSFEEAKKKIAKALKGKKLKINFPETSAYWIMELKTNLDKVGPYFDLQALDSTTYLNNVEKGDFQLAPLSWEGDLPEATNFLQLYYRGSQVNAQNLSHYSSPAFDAAFDKLSKLFPSAERKKLSEEAHKIVLKDLPAIPMGFKREFSVVGKRATQLNTKSFGASSLKDFLLAP